MSSIPPALELEAVQLPRKRRSRAGQNEEKRRLLLASAWEVLQERGYQAMTLEDVADRAGFTRQPIYTLFGSKEQLALALQEELTTRSIRFLEDIKPGRTLASTLTRLADRATELSKSPDFKVQLELATAMRSLAFRDEAIRVRVTDLIRAYHEFSVSWLQECAEATGGSFRIPVERVARLVGAGIAGIWEIGAVDPDFSGAQLKRDLLLLCIE